MVNSQPAKQETWVQFLGREDPLQKETAAHSNVPAWEIPFTEEPGRLPSTGLQRHDLETKLQTSWELSLPSYRACELSSGMGLKRMSHP